MFDNCSNAYDDSAMHRWVAQRSVAGLDIRSRSTVLDVAAGTGLASRVLLADQPGLTCIAVDLSAGLLATARRSGLHVMRGDVERLPIHAAAVDWVVCVSAAAYFPHSLHQSGRCSPTHGGRPCPIRRYHQDHPRSPSLSCGPSRGSSRQRTVALTPKGRRPKPHRRRPTVRPLSPVGRRHHGPPVRIRSGGSPAGLLIVVALVLVSAVAGWYLYASRSATGEPEVAAAEPTQVRTGPARATSVRLRTITTARRGLLQLRE